MKQENATNESNGQLFGMTRYEPSVSQDLSHCHHFCIESMHYETKELHFFFRLIRQLRSSPQLDFYCFTPETKSFPFLKVNLIVHSIKFTAQMIQWKRTMIVHSNTLLVKSLNVASACDLMFSSLWAIQGSNRILIHLASSRLRIVPLLSPY
jgi:hypothetical protein